MRVLRSSLFVAATAIIAAACGDKVNVVGPSSGTGTLKIQSVVVAPNPATITAGTSVQLTAAVSADAGVTTTVVWSTTNSGVATVSQSGLVAGVSAGAVGICAAASATNAATVSGCATVNVSPAATTVNAVIQIASITTQAGGLNAPVPVPPAAVAGQINVSVNVNPGTERMDSVVVMVNGISAATQTFTGAQAAALRAAADAAADQALQQTLVFSINTAAYATAGCATQIAPCGTPTFLNGPATISVVGYGHQGATAATNTVSQGVALLFGNADSWIVAQTLGAGANTAANAAGFNFSGGQTASVSVTSVPVSYSGLGIASAVVNYGTAACDASGTAQRALTMTAPVAPSRAWTATFPRATQTAPKITAGLGVDVNNYSFNPVACAAANAAGGEGANMASALYTTNVNAPVGFALGSTIPVVRLDNLAPGAPAMVQNPNGRQNGWINGAVALTGSSAALSATSNNWTVAGAADLGVGGYTTMLRIGAPSATGTVSGVITLAGSATPTLPAPALTNLTYCAVASATDKLGNESTLPIATAVCTLPVVGPGAALAVTTPTAETFGVDIAPPTITMSAGSIAASSAGVGSTGASVGGEFQVTVLDTGAVGNSGMLAAGPVNATVTIRTAAAGLTAAQLCPVGTVTAGVCTASATGFAAPAFPFVTTNTVAAQTIIGYYTFSAVSIDAAGNVSTNTVTRVRTYNPAANVPALTASLFSTPLNGPTATFTATGSSGNTTVNGPTTFFDLWKVNYNLTYAGGLAGPLVFPATILQTFNASPLVNSNVPVGVTINGFVRQVENQTSACNAALAVGGAFKPNQLSETLLDMVGNSSGAVLTPIAAGSVTAGVSYLANPVPAQQVWTFITSNGVSEQPTAGGCQGGAGVNSAVKVSEGGTSPSSATVTLTADVFGPTATFNPPFASVNFYVLVGANLELIGTTSTFSTTDDGSAQGRKHSYTLVWTPGSKSPVTGTAFVPVASAAACAAANAANLQVYAVGVSAAGDGLVSPLNANICGNTAP